MKTPSQSPGEEPPKNPFDDRNTSNIPFVMAAICACVAIYCYTEKIKDFDVIFAISAIVFIVVRLIPHNNDDGGASEL